MQFLYYNASNLFSLKEVGVTLSNQGLVLVNGFSIDESSSNGSGKSSLINKGFLWTLFGETAEGLKGDAVINKDANTAEAQLGFKIDNKNYFIKRTRDRKKGTSLLFSQNPLDLSLRDARDTQALIDQTIGRNLKTFIQTDFFGQGNSTPFMKLTASGQREVLENILPFEQLDEWLNNTKEAKKLISQEDTAAKQSQSNALSATETLQAQRMNMERQSINWTTTRASTISTLNKELAGLQSSNICNKIKALRDRLASDSSLKLPPDADNAMLDLVNTFNQDNKNLNSVETEYENTKKEVEYIKKLIQKESCPSCGQKYPDTTKRDQAIKDLPILELKLKSLVLNLESKRDKSLKSKEAMTLLSSIKSSHAGVIKQLAELNEDEHLQKIAVLRSKINGEAIRTNPYTETLEQLSKSIENTRNICKKFTQKLETINKESSFISVWEKAYSQTLRILLYERVCPFLTKRANYHLQGLHNAQIEINFSTTKILKSEETKSEFTATAYSSSGASTYSLLSGGEQQIVDFAVGLALADLAATQVKGRSNIMILDEPFVGLDSKNSEAIIAYLKEEVSKTKDSIFLVSNEELLKGLIPNHITVEKINGQTSIV